jgi:hypothetical protein
MGAMAHRAALAERHSLRRAAVSGVLRPVWGQLRGGAVGARRAVG